MTVREGKRPTTPPPGPPVTTRDCLRNALRRTGRAVPPSADAIAAPLTDDELGELIDRLQVIWMKRQVPA